MDNNELKRQNAFSKLMNKTAEVGKKAVGGAKNLAEQTQKTIHEQQAKKYTAVTEKEFRDKDFQMPSIVKIEADDANREFIENVNAVGWIEKHKDVRSLHIYSAFVNQSGLVFVPIPQRGGVYCADNFDTTKYINANQVFGKATEEKLAELNYIAYCLGAKSCLIEIVEANAEMDSRSASVGVKQYKVGASATSTSSQSQSGKTVSYFEGHDNPERPKLRWFEHDDNIKVLIEMRCKKAIKSTSLELKGASHSTMSMAVACAVDCIFKSIGSASMEKQLVKEHNSNLLFEIEF